MPLRPGLTVASNLERFQNYSQATSDNRAPHINTYILNFLLGADETLDLGVSHDDHAVAMEEDAAQVLGEQVSWLVRSRVALNSHYTAKNELADVVVAKCDVL